MAAQWPWTWGDFLSYPLAVEAMNRLRTTGWMILLMSSILLLDDATQPLLPGFFRTCLLAGLLCLGIFEILERAGYWTKSGKIRKLALLAAMVIGPNLVRLVIH